MAKLSACDHLRHDLVLGSLRRVNCSSKLSSNVSDRLMSRHLSEPAVALDKGVRFRDADNEDDDDDDVADSFRCLKSLIILRDGVTLKLAPLTYSGGVVKPFAGICSGEVALTLRP